MIISSRRYNGDLIHKRFAYEHFRKQLNPTGDIVAFVGEMDVTTNLIDLEDTLQNDYIWSDKAINFCWEIPNLCPIGAVAFQRYFNTGIAMILSKYVNGSFSVDGDDIMIDGKKASVSITYSKEGVALGHTGININAGDKAPNFAYSTNLSDKEAYYFITKVIEDFYHISRDMFIASTKISV